MNKSNWNHAKIINHESAKGYQAIMYIYKKLQRIIEIFSLINNAIVCCTC